MADSQPALRMRRSPAMERCKIVRNVRHCEKPSNLHRHRPSACVLIHMLQEPVGRRQELNSVRVTHQMHRVQSNVALDGDAEMFSIL